MNFIIFSGFFFVFFLLLNSLLTPSRNIILMLKGAMRKNKKKSLVFINTEARNKPSFFQYVREESCCALAQISAIPCVFECMLLEGIILFFSRVPIRIISEIIKHMLYSIHIKNIACVAFCRAEEFLFLFISWHQ